MKMAPIDDDDDEDREHTLALEEAVVAAKTKAVEQTNRLNERAAEFQTQADKLRAQSRQLLQDAERLEQREAKVKARAKEAKELSESLSFEHLLLRLKRNDWINTVDGRTDVPTGRGKALGEALLQNARVEELDLDVTVISPIDDYTPLIQYISTSTKLQQLGLYNTKGFSNLAVLCKMTDVFLNAISQSTSIRHVTCDALCTAAAFSRLVTTSVTLEKLEMTFDGTYSTSDAQVIAAAFASLPDTFRDLTLTMRQNDELFISILANLRNYRLLRELVLVAGEGCNEAYFDAVSQFLPTVTTLESFALVNFQLDQFIMANVLSGLRGAGTKFDYSRTMLFFRKCTFDNGAAEELVSFLETKMERRCKTYVGHLYQIRISMDGWSPDLSRRLAESFLSAPNDERSDSADEASESSPMQTVGYQMDRIALVNVQRELLEYWSNHAERLGLGELELYGISESASKALYPLIPKLRVWHALQFADVVPEGVTWILRGLKECSLHDTIIGTSNAGNDDWIRNRTVSTSSFSPRQQRLIEAYIERNNLLNYLLESEPRVDNEVDDTSSSNLETGFTTTADEAIVESKIEQCRYLSLLQVAQQIPDSTSTNVIRGMFKLGQQAGPNYVSGETAAVGNESPVTSKSEATS